MNVFIDTSAFYALVDWIDKNHEKARRIRDSLRGEDMWLYTSNYIFDESVTLIRAKLGFETALDFGNKMMHSKAVKMLKVTEEIENKAWGIFCKYKDKELSFTYCTKEFCLPLWKGLG
jgi:predicted nucleic acid-binding protein